MGREMHTEFWLENLKRTLGKPGTDGMIKWKYFYRKRLGGHGFIWL